MTEIWTVKKILDWTNQFFTEKQVPEARLSAEWLLADVLSCRRIELYLQFDRILTPDERAAFREFVKRRAAREPVQYILGETEFYGFPIKVTPDVLIPRPETELLVDFTVDYFRTNQDIPQVIMDIGTGSGCIAIALAKRLVDASVSAVDISEAALAVAKTNAVLNDADIHFHHADFLKMDNLSDKKFSVIVSNPPYVAETDWPGVQPEVRNFEPKTALLAGKDGLDFYRQLIPQLKNWLSPNGAVFLEVGYNQALEVKGFLDEANFSTEIKKDYHNIDRIVTGTKLPPIHR
ncbi:MAG: peptide chain release factor N(5)-glutamine methyltransferase [Calditrichia bacterium]